MACGIPVVASNRTSVPEVVGDGGWLIDPRDTDAMGEAIIQMLMDDKIRNRFIQKGLRQAQRFDEERTAGELHHHLRQLGENFV
jgi:glycosyltransferase involved in cell wall biosynthesis